MLYTCWCKHLSDFWKNPHLTSFVTWVYINFSILPNSPSFLQQLVWGYVAFCSLCIWHVLFSNSQRQSSSCTPTVRVPRPSPVSPTVLTDYQKRMLWKKKLQACSERADIHNEKGNASVVGVHELYENDELLQDWKDVYITSAYLVWCQTSRVISSVNLFVQMLRAKN